MDTARIKWKREPFTETELRLVMETLVYEREKQGSFFIQCADPLIVETILQDEAEKGQVAKCYIDGNFAGIVYFDVAKPWWTDDLVLMEQLILCVNPYFAGFGRRACDFMEETAKQYDLKYIIAGCLFQDNPQMITNLYKKKGYMTVNPMYIKTLEV